MFKIITKNKFIWAKWLDLSKIRIPIKINDIREQWEEFTKNNDIFCKSIFLYICALTFMFVFQNI